VTDDPFDRLLDAMLKIAEAVNAFASPDAPTGRSMLFQPRLALGSGPSCLTLNVRFLGPVATSQSVAGGTVPAHFRAQPSRYVVARLARCRDVARRVAALPDERSSGCRSTPCSTSSSGHFTDGRPRGLGRDRRRGCALLSM
jgi:hypothetical protein